MNKGIRVAATLNSPENPFRFRACFFHCTPVSERRKRSLWVHGSSSRRSQKEYNLYIRRVKRRSLLSNVSEFAERFFKSWQPNGDEYILPSGSRGVGSWFRPNFRDDAYTKTGKSRNRNSRGARSDFDFCDDDDYDDVEFEKNFRSTFGGTRGFNYSFTDDDETRYRNSSSYSNSNSGTYEYNEKHDSSSNNYKSKPTLDHMTKDMRALGLSQSGPVNLDDVKNAYRACALKWHPDRHPGSSKVVAEEKFKVCSAAYESLCNKLDLH